MAAAAPHHSTRPWYVRPPVWVLGVVVLGLAVFAIVKLSSGPAATPYGDFLDQLDAGNVASVTLQGTQISGHFKHAIAAQAAKDAAPRDSFHSQVPDVGDPTLLPELRKEHVVIDVVSSSNWLSWFGRLPWPMVLIIAGLLIAGLVRLARGNKSTTSSTAGVHPMQGVIGLVSGLSGTHSQATHQTTQDPGTAKSG